MAGLPRGFVKGLLVGGVAAILWKVLADRRARTVVVDETMRMVEAVPFLGSRVQAVVARQLVGVYRAVAEDVVSHVGTGELMELGSGPGYLAVELGRRARELRVTTMDPSPYMVQLAESRIHGAGLGRQVKVTLGDAHDIPFPDECFDALLSLGYLHRWRSPEMVLGEIHRVLRPGGAAWIYDLRKEMPEDGWEMIRGRVPLPARPLFDAAVMMPRRSAYTEGEIAALVARSPFGGAQIGVLTVELAGTRAPALTRVMLRR